jgi:hypothetical protein
MMMMLDVGGALIRRQSVKDALMNVSEGGPHLVRDIPVHRRDAAPPDGPCPSHKQLHAPNAGRCLRLSGSATHSFAPACHLPPLPSTAPTSCATASPRRAPSRAWLPSLASRSTTVRTLGLNGPKLVKPRLLLDQRCTCAAPPPACAQLGGRCLLPLCSTRDTPPRPRLTTPLPPEHARHFKEVAGRAYSSGKDDANLYRPSEPEGLPTSAPAEGPSNGTTK